MAALTGEEVVSAVARNIRAQFSENIIKKIYKEISWQNTQKPYAFIHQITSGHKNEMRNRGEWNFMIDVRVHPEDNQTNVNSWARGIATGLIDALNVITVSGQAVKASSIEHRVEDNVLHFIVSYAFKVIRITDAVPDMRKMRYGQHIK